jgi:hypothetical protein
MKWNPRGSTTPIPILTVKYGPEYANPVYTLSKPAVCEPFRYFSISSLSAYKVALSLILKGKCVQNESCV